MINQRPEVGADLEILIYQPNLALGQEWTNHLRRQGAEYHVRQTASREQAQRWLAEEKVDLCALDVASAEDVDLFFDLRMALPHVRTLLTAERPLTHIVEELALTGASIHLMDAEFSQSKFHAAVLQTVQWGRGGADAPLASVPPDQGTAIPAAAPGPRQTQRISGNLSVLLPDLVQLKCLTGSSCVLEISAAQDVGEVYFDRGNIVHSRTSSLVGADALVSIFTWSNSRFKVDPWREPETRSIRDRWESLLLDIARQVDEAKHHQEQASELTAAAAA